MNKVQRFEEVKKLSNVMEYSYNDFLNKKNIQIFPNYALPWILELACGKGEYCVQMAKMYPETPILGVDIKGNRLWVGAKYCLLNNLLNVKFLRTDINNLDAIIPAKSVSDIWLTFPDPYIKKSGISKRLTHTKFITKYRHFLIPDGKVHLKTDSELLFQFTLEMIAENHATLTEKKILPIDYVERDYDFPFNVKTHYENLNISKSKYIYYLSFSL